MKHNDRLIQMNLKASLRKHLLSTHALTRLPSLHALMARIEHLVALALTQHIAVLLERAAGELSLLPKVGSQEAVGVGDGDEGGLEGVLKGLGRTGRGRVSVVDTSQLQQTLHGGRSDKAGTTRSWDQLVHNVSSTFDLSLREMDGHTLTVTEPHLPLSLTGIECGSPRLEPQ